MENENKDFFDYDSYMKNSGKKKKRQKRRSNNQQKAATFVAAENKSSEKLDKIKEESHESIENIKRMFDDALDENVEEIAEFVGTDPEPEMPADLTPQKTKRRLYFVLGIIITLLAIVGLVSTVNFSVDKVKAFADNTQQKNEFAKFIYPVVICDPPSFDQTTKLRNDTMLTAAIWDIILYEDKSKYESDFDYIVVPEVDVEQHAIKLFGSGYSYAHESIMGADIQFYYVEDIKSYRIPSNPKYFTYSPYIDDIKRVGERYTITVGYVSPTPAWLTLTSDDVPLPDKYVDYVVTKHGDELILIAIQKSEKEYESHHGL